MGNYKAHIADIDKEFANTFFAEYMQGEWGITVGYTPRPVWYVVHQKAMGDYQILSEGTCDGSLLADSKGSISYTCCPSGSTVTESEGPLLCCPEGYYYASHIQMCVQTINSDSIDPIPCPCCPDGYLYSSSTGKCHSGGNTKNPVVCPSYCLDAVGNKNPLIACPDRVPDVTLLSEPEYGGSGQACCETMVTPWTGCC